MVGPEFHDYSEEQFNKTAINRLKIAAAKMSPALIWESSDGIFHYAAAPINYLPNEDLKPVSVELIDKMNAWNIYRQTRDFEVGSVMIDIYTIGKDFHLMVSSSHEIPDELYEDDAKMELFAHLLRERATQAMLGLTEPAIEDYADIDNALYDLEHFSDQAI